MIERRLIVTMIAEARFGIEQVDEPPISESGEECNATLSTAERLIRVWRGCPAADKLLYVAEAVSECWRDALKGGRP